MILRKRSVAGLKILLRLGLGLSCCCAALRRSLRDSYHNWESEQTPRPSGVCHQWPVEMMEHKYSSSSCGPQLRAIVAEGPDQAQLDAFCKSHCGSEFSREIADWRSWCQEERALRMDWADHNNTVVRDDPAVAYGWLRPHLLGCTRDSGGDYCALWWAERIKREPQGCAYFSSCCWGEVIKVFEFSKAEDWPSCPTAINMTTKPCPAEP